MEREERIRWLESDEAKMKRREIPVYIRILKMLQSLKPEVSDAVVYTVCCVVMFYSGGLLIGYENRDLTLAVGFMVESEILMNLWGVGVVILMFGLYGRSRTLIYKFLCYEWSLNLKRGGI